MRQGELHVLISCLNQVIDRELHRGVTIEEVRRLIDNGTLFAWLM